MLAYITGSVDQELLLRNAYLVTENRLLRKQIPGRIRDTARITRVSLPPRSPNLNAYTERWVRSIKDEALSRLILFGERALWYGLAEYVARYHSERPHQGKGNVILIPSVDHTMTRHGTIRYRERLGGLLKYYSQEAA